MCSEAHRRSRICWNASECMCLTEIRVNSPLLFTPSVSSISKTQLKKSVIDVEIHWMTCHHTYCCWSGDAPGQTVSVGGKMSAAIDSVMVSDCWITRLSLSHSAVSVMQQKRPSVSYKFAPSGRATRRWKQTSTTVLSALRATRPTT